MKSVSPEFFVESLSLVLYAVLAGAFTVGGLFVEYTSFQYLSGGEFVTAAWLALFGAIMLYAGAYGIGYQKLLARSS